ncbi:unnamed protein product [Notodromas monacha]|uniref:EB domain-containing protein n=1 Tax=Notodromas monacha TaxID=399045 RepID=A0A7R9GGV8_9CRUS|nr:unnamed protein product [Notodromas monacha]CAG0922129.1 unnamed protein product [Notodromas monacha]
MHAVGPLGQHQQCYQLCAQPTDICENPGGRAGLGKTRPFVVPIRDGAPRAPFLLLFTTEPELGQSSVDPKRLGNTTSVSNFLGPQTGSFVHIMHPLFIHFLDNLVSVTRKQLIRPQNVNGVCELFNTSLCDPTNSNSLTWGAAGWSYHDVANTYGQLTSQTMLNYSACTTQGFCAKTCARIMGQPCNMNSQCLATTEGSGCDLTLASPTCQCLTGTYVIVKKLNDSCADNQECLASLPNSQCGATGKCECDSLHVAYNSSYCMYSKILGDACSNNRECTTTILDSVCSSKTCVCPAPMVSYNTTACMTPLAYGDTCANTQECAVSVANTVCSSSLTCECTTGYTWSPTTSECLQDKILNSTCSRAIECSLKIPGATCNGNKCVCTTGTVAYNQTTCMTDRMLNSTCTRAVECSVTIPGGATCTANKCVCSSGTVAYDQSLCMTPISFENRMNQRSFRNHLMPGDTCGATITTSALLVLALDKECANTRAPRA